MSELPAGFHEIAHRPGSLPATALSRRIDAFLRRLGDAASWIWIALLATIVVNVVSRYVFGEGRIEFEELQWHLYAVGFLVGMAVSVEADAHVRVDVLRERFSPRTRAWVDLYGILLLLTPFLLLILVYSMPFVWLSWQQGEISAAPGGLPYRFVIKGALFAGFALIALAAFARLLRVSALLFGAPRPLPPEDGEA